MSCYGCIFKGKYEDMGASCDVCKLQDYLPDAVKACDNSENCPHRVTLEEAKKKLLSSDVVEVVRCKDCKHRYVPIRCALWYGSLDDKEYFIERGENFYCPWGERSENGKS